MDTSKEYIKMCEKADEIQEKWKPQVGDRFDGGWIMGEPNHGVYDDLIWLPSQDQLQEMIGEGFLYKESRLEELLRNFLKFLEYIGPHGTNSINADLIAEFPSMEQLWLAFCMAELYQKCWNGTEWRKKDGV